MLKKQLNEEVDKFKAQQEINKKELDKPKNNSYKEAVNNILYYMMNDSAYIKMYLKTKKLF